MNSSGAGRPVRWVLAAAGAALVGGLGFAAPAAAYVAAAPGITYLSAGRLGASVGGLLGLAGVIVGWIAVARPGSRLGVDSGSLGAIVSVTAGLVAIALGTLVVATSDGGIGTGNGRGGAYVALAVGLVSVVLGGRALARTRRGG